MLTLIYSLQLSDLKEALKHELLTPLNGRLSHKTGNINAFQHPFQDWIDRIFWYLMSTSSTVNFKL